MRSSRVTKSCSSENCKPCCVAGDAQGFPKANLTPAVPGSPGWCSSCVDTNGRT